MALMNFNLITRPASARAQRPHRCVSTRGATRTARASRSAPHDDPCSACALRRAYVRPHPAAGQRRRASHHPRTIHAPRHQRTRIYNPHHLRLLRRSSMRAYANPRSAPNLNHTYAITITRGRCDSTRIMIPRREHEHTAQPGPICALPGSSRAHVFPE